MAYSYYLSQSSRSEMVTFSFWWIMSYFNFSAFEKKVFPATCCKQHESCIIEARIIFWRFSYFGTLSLYFNDNLMCTFCDKNQVHTYSLRTLKWTLAIRCYKFVTYLKGICLENNYSWYNHIRDFFFVFCSLYSTLLYCIISKWCTPFTV